MLHSPPFEEVGAMRGRLVAVLAVLVSSLGGPQRIGAQNGRVPDWTRLNAEALQHFQALLRLDTQNPPGNEHVVTEYVKSVLEKEGISVQVFATDPKRPNLVARLKGNGRKRPILYMGHSDVVTVDPKKWTFPPFSATRDGGYIYGRGSLDDRPHVVAGLMALLTLKRLDVPLDRDVILLVESGEEGTTGVGIGYMTSQHADAIAAEYCLAETGTVARVGGKVTYAGIQMTEKVPRRVELVATGPSGHASRPLLGNAVVHLAAAVAAVGKWRVPMRLNETTAAFFTRMAEISPGTDAARYRALLEPSSPAALTADAWLADREPGYSSMMRTSISPTMIEAGYRINVIPSEARATLDVRMLPDENPDQFLVAMKRVINDPAVVARYVTDPGLTRPSGKPARLDSEAFRTIETAVGRTYDTVTIPTMSTGATDMAHVRGTGTECYGIGPATDLEDGPKGFGAHSDQERILESELYRFVRFSYDIVYDLARATTN
jgi:acetylornithine deacetylase/succinyl-diaminopimelate desuccinylase-like protein